MRCITKKKNNKIKNNKKNKIIKKQCDLNKLINVKTSSQIQFVMLINNTNVRYTDYFKPLNVNTYC